MPSPTLRFPIASGSSFGSSFLSPPKERKRAQSGQERDLCDITPEHFLPLSHTAHGVIVSEDQPLRRKYLTGGRSDRSANCFRRPAAQ